MTRPSGELEIACTSLRGRSQPASQPKVVKEFTGFVVPTTREVGRVSLHTASQCRATSEHLLSRSADATKSQANAKPRREIERFAHLRPDLGMANDDEGRDLWGKGKRFELRANEGAMGPGARFAGML